MNTIHIDEDTMIRAANLVGRSNNITSTTTSSSTATASENPKLNKPIDKTEARRQKISVQSTHIRNAVSQEGIIRFKFTFFF